MAERVPILKFCKEKGIHESWEDICQNQKIKSLILADVTAIGKKEGLKSFEQVRIRFK